MNKFCWIFFVAFLALFPTAHSQEFSSDSSDNPSITKSSKERPKPVSVHADVFYVKRYDFMKDIVNLGVNVQKEAASYQYKSTPILQIPAEEEIGSRISHVLKKKFENEKLNISVAADNHHNFNKRDPATNALLFVEVSYKIYTNDNNKSVLVGVMSPVLKRLNPLEDSRSKYLMLPASPVIFFLSNDNEQSQKSLDEAIDKLTSALIIQITNKY